MHRAAWTLALLLWLACAPAAHAAGNVTIRKQVAGETVPQAGLVTLSYEHRTSQDDYWDVEHACGADCSSRTDFVLDDWCKTGCQVNQQVTLSGAAAAGFAFDGCSGGCTRSIGSATTISGLFSDVAAPAPVFAGPAPASEVRDSITVSADATDNHRVARVDFSLNGVTVADDTPDGTRFSATLDTSTIPHGAAVTVTARAFDPSGNSASAVRTFVVDRAVDVQFAAPTPAAGGWVTAGDPRVGIAADADVVARECRVVPAAFAPCGALPWTPATAADGAYTVEVRVTDDAGNAKTIATAFKVDRTGPQLTITSPRDGAFLAGGFTPAITASDAMTSPPRVACALDLGAYAACGAIPKPADGPHVLRVRAADDAGHVTERTASLTVDGTPPELAFTGGPPENAIVDRPDVTFGLGVGDLTPVQLTCTLDVSTTPCTGPDRHALTGIEDGPHELVVAATDAAGNRTRIARRFTVNAARPTVEITAGPGEGAAIAARTATFGFRTTGAADVACALDDGGWRACAAADADVLADLPDGVHTFRVRARDATDDVAVAARGFRVDTSAPETRIDAGPGEAAAVAADAVTFAFSASVPDASFRCRWGGSGPFTACSGPGTTHRVAGLAPGRYVFEVQAVNALGTADPTPARRTFTLLRAAQPLQFRVTNLWGLPSARQPRTSVVKLALTRLASGARVQVRCTGGGCPFARKAGKVRRGGANLTRLFRGRKLRPGAVVEIRVTLAGADGRVVRFAVRRRGIPKRTDLCVPAGARKPERC